MWNKNTEFDTTNTWIIGDGYDGVNMPSESDRSHLYDCMLRATDTVVRKYASWHSLANNADTQNCRISDTKHGTDGGGWHAYSTGTGVWQRQGVIKAFSKGRPIIDYVEESDAFMYVFLQYRGERRLTAVDSGQPTLDLSLAECQTYGEAYYGWRGTYTGALQPTGCHLLRTTYQYGGNTYPTNT